MTREMLGNSVREAVHNKFDSRCAICSYDAEHGLRIHHVIPVSFGGKDEIENLVLLCANCHSQVHHYGSKRFANRSLREVVRDKLSLESLQMLETLTQAIHQARTRAEQNGGVVERPFRWEEALEAVSRRNRYNEVKRKQFMTAMTEVITRMPSEVRSRCSFRLMRSEKYISINIMNYLLFRAPAHSDMGGAPVYECFFTTPSNTSLSQWAKAEGHDVFTFAYFDAINVGLSYKQLLELSESDWKNFSEACLMAFNARRQREWTSNIELPDNLRK